MYEILESRAKAIEYDVSYSHITLEKNASFIWVLQSLISYYIDIHICILDMVWGLQDKTVVLLCTNINTTLLCSFRISYHTWSRGNVWGWLKSQLLNPCGPDSSSFFLIRQIFVQCSRFPLIHPIAWLLWSCLKKQILNRYDLISTIRVPMRVTNHERIVQALLWNSDPSGCTFRSVPQYLRKHTALDDYYRGF